LLRPYQRCFELVVCWRVFLLCELRPPALQRFLSPAPLDLDDKSQSQGLKVWLWPGAPLLHSCFSYSL